MAATTDIFEHRNRRAGVGQEAGPDDVARARVLNERIEEFAERLADRIAPLLSERLANRLGLTHEELAERLRAPAPKSSEGLVDAHEIARRTGRSRWWVYEHAGELGAVRLGSGSRPRLAFRPSRVDEYLRAAAQLRQPIPAPVRARPQRRRRQRRTSSGVELLPIRGHDA